MDLKRYLKVSKKAAVDTATWIDTEGPQIHPAFSTPSHFDMQRAEFQRRLPHHSLQEAVQRYRIDVEKSTIVELSEPDNLTWSAIFDKAREAERRYEADGKGVKGAHRKLGRTVGDYASAFQALAQLVPNTDYTSAIRGGLDIIFTAAAQMANVRGIILDFFGDLPDTVYRMQRLQQLHAKDDATYAISLQFNEALLRALEGTINWLTEGQNRKHFKSIFLPDESRKSIEDLLQSVKKQMQRMEERRDEILAQRVGEIHRNTNQSRVELPVIRHDANRAATNTDKILESHSKQNFQSQRDREQLARIEQNGIDTKNGMFHVLYQQALNAAWWKGLYEGKMLAAPVPFMDQGDLFAALGVDEETLEKDLRSTQHHSHRMDTLPQGGALWLMKCPLFMDRLYSDRPGALFVERDCPPGSQDAFERMSAFSALTAMLTRTIGIMQPTKVVQFFCGRHTSSSDPLGGPNGLIRGILAQLLRLGNFNLSFIDSRTPKEYIQRHSLGQLTDTLKRLVRQLDRHVILFIFVDGVSLLERGEWIQDLNKVMYDLRELTWDKTVAATVKIIVTNPGKSRGLGSCIASEDRVLVPYLPSIGDGKLTDRMVNKELHTLRGDPAFRQEPDASNDIDSEGEFDIDWLL